MNLDLSARALFVRGQYQRSEVFTDVDHDRATRCRRRHGLDGHVITVHLVAVRVVLVRRDERVVFVTVRVLVVMTRGSAPGDVRAGSDVLGGTVRCVAQHLAGHCAHLRGRVVVAVPRVGEVGEVRAVGESEGFQARHGLGLARTDVKEQARGGVGL